MPQIINTNIPSLTAQRNLNSSQSDLATSLQRLSSGLRINSAKDDAAGLAISERFSTQINGLNQAIRNANDGISFAQTAEGALASVGDSLQRMRELAVQSANDTNSASDRAAIDNEVQQLLAEIGRVANATEFNGQRVLDGSLNDLFFQIGANQGQTIAVSGVDARTSELGTYELVGGAASTQTQIESGITGVTDATVDINGVAVAVSLSTASIASYEDIAREINTAIATAAQTDTDVADGQVTASLRVDNTGGTTIVLNGAYDMGTGDKSATAADLITLTGGVITFGDTTSTDLSQAASDQVELSTIDVSTRNDAYQAIAIADGALTQVNTLRSELGSFQTRFESTIANLEITSENLSASRSRIRDADFAAETAELTRNQILQQAGISVLSQANALPQNVLALLQ
jgi:flagellin